MYTCSTDVCDPHHVYHCRPCPCVGCRLMFQGDVYLCRPGCLIEVQVWAGQHHLIRGPQMSVSGPFVLESPASVLNKNKVLWAPCRQMRNLQGQSLGVDLNVCFRQFWCKAVFEDLGTIDPGQSLHFFFSFEETEAFRRYPILPCIMHSRV